MYRCRHVIVSLQRAYSDVDPGVSTLSSCRSWEGSRTGRPWDLVIVSEKTGFKYSECFTIVDISGHEEVEPNVVEGLVQNEISQFDRQGSCDLHKRRILRRGLASASTIPIFLSDLFTLVVKEKVDGVAISGA